MKHNILFFFLVMVLTTIVFAADDHLPVTITQHDTYSANSEIENNAKSIIFYYNDRTDSYVNGNLELRNTFWTTLFSRDKPYIHDTETGNNVYSVSVTSGNDEFPTGSHSLPSSVGKPDRILFEDSQNHFNVADSYWVIDNGVYAPTSIEINGQPYTTFQTTAPSSSGSSDFGTGTSTSGTSTGSSSTSTGSGSSSSGIGTGTSASGTSTGSSSTGTGSDTSSSGVSSGASTSGAGFEQGSAPNILVVKSGTLEGLNSDANFARTPEGSFVYHSGDINYEIWQDGNTHHTYTNMPDGRSIYERFDQDGARQEFLRGGQATPYAVEQVGNAEERTALRQLPSANPASTPAGSSEPAPLVPNLYALPGYGTGPAPAGSASPATPAAPVAPATPAPKANPDGSWNVGTDIYTKGTNDEFSTPPDSQGNRQVLYPDPNVENGFLIVTYDSTGKPVGTPVEIKPTASGTATTPAGNTLITDPATIARIQAARANTPLMDRQNLGGSQLSAQERTALQSAIQANTPAYIGTNGVIGNKQTDGAVAIPPALASIIANQNPNVQRTGSSSWQFVTKGAVETSGLHFRESTQPQTVITLRPNDAPDSWSTRTTTTTRSCSGCDLTKTDGQITRIVDQEKVEKTVTWKDKEEKPHSDTTVVSTTNYIHGQLSATSDAVSAKPTAGVRTTFESREDIIKGLKGKEKTDAENELPPAYSRPKDVEIFNPANPSKVIARRDEHGNFVDTSGKAIDDWRKYLKENGIAEQDIERTGRVSDDATLERGLAGGVLGTIFWSGAFSTLGFGRSVGLLMQGYDQYRGLTQITTLAWAPGWNREELARQFCLGAGIENCLTSSICGSIHEITADNVLAGRGPGGELTSSAALNAQRSRSIIMKDLTRQQLLDILGNTTVVKGRRVDLTDSSFDPSTLGNVTIRLYHVEFSVTNSVSGEEDLRFNLEFRRSSPVEYVAPPRRNVSSIEDVQGDIQQFFNSLPSSSYGEAVSTAKWFPSDQTLSTGLKAHDHKYKYSTNEYDNACLTFDPGLPSEGANSGGVASELCVPFREYVGGPQKIEGIAPQERRPGAQNNPSAPVRPQPEGLSI